MIQCKEPFTRYQISEDGQTVYDTITEKINPGEHSVPEGYVFLNMINDFGEVKLIRKHRLIALNLIPIPERLKGIPVDKLQINHIDENPRNNHLDNIEWVTASENKQRGNYLKSSMKNLTNHRIVYQYNINTKELVNSYKNTWEAARNGFSSSGVSRCCTGKYKQHKGYVFSYLPPEEYIKQA